MVSALCRGYCQRILNFASRYYFQWSFRMAFSSLFNVKNAQCEKLWKRGSSHFQKLFDLAAHQILAFCCFHNFSIENVINCVYSNLTNHLSCNNNSYMEVFTLLIVHSIHQWNSCFSLHWELFISILYSCHIYNNCKWRKRVDFAFEHPADSTETMISCFYY